MVWNTNNGTVLNPGKQLNNGGYFGRTVAYKRKLENPMDNTGNVGTHIGYETDADGNRVEVLYDSTGKILSSKKVGTATGSEYNSDPTSSTGTGAQFTASNWQKLIELLKSKFGINI